MGQSGSLPVTPASITFVAGVWTGNVTVDALDPNVTLHVHNGAGQTGTSGSFAVQYGPLAGYQWSTIASPQAQGTPLPATLTAKDAHGFTVTDFSGAVTLSGFTGTSQKILLYQASYFDYFQTALNALGLSYTTYTTDSAFESALAGANPSTTLAIVDDAEDESAFANLPAFINGGGAVIFGDWYLQVLPSVASALGASVPYSINAPLPVYDWGESSLFARLPSPMGLEYYYNWNGQLLQPTGSGIAVAGLQNTPAADQAALVVANSGRTILNGFLFDDVATSASALQLAENEIQTVLGNSSVRITPTTATLANGVWSGSVTVWPGASDSMFLEASDTNGNGGDSNTFMVTGFPAPLTVTVPADATEGGPSQTGAVAIPAALDFDLYVSLASSSTAVATVPSTVTIPAGQTSASFPITIINSSSLDGLQSVAISAMAAGCSPGSGAINVHDDQTAVLSVSMPSSAQETAGVLTGTITSSAAPASNITVQLSSSDPTGLTVPATVVLDAGKTTATLSIVMHDDHVIEGSRPITVRATAPNWTSGSATLTDLDDDATLAVVLPDSGWKGQTLSGTLQLGGALTTALVVPLTSSNPALLTVPATVTIPAGQTSATFAVTLRDNNLRQGPQSVQVTAAATGLAVQNGSMTVDDSDVDHLTFNAVSSAPVAGVPFTVTVSAYDIQNNLIRDFNGTVNLTAYGQSGPLSIGVPGTPGRSTITFSSGVWSGSVTVSAADPDVRLQAIAGDGALGTSGVFAVSQLQVSTPSPLPPAAVSQPYSSTLAAAGGIGAYTWSAGGTNYTESQPATGWLGGGTAQGWQGINESWSLALPFAFPFYGTSYNSVWIDSNGYLDFTTSAVSSSNSDSGLASAVRIAPIWQFMSTASPFGVDDIYVTSNSTYVAVRWSADADYYSSSSEVNVEAVLFANGNIEFNYGPSAFANSPTIGISEGDNTHFTLSRYDGATSLPAYASVLFTPPTALPSGLSLSSAGVLSGTVTTAGAYNFSVTTTDSASPAHCVVTPFVLNVVTSLLSLAVPASATEGVGTVNGTVTTQSALSGPLTVDLASSDTARVTVPSSVTIPAGQTSEPVTITILDNALNGPEAVTVTAAAAGYGSGTGTITVHDNETATLTVSVPSSANEDAGLLADAGTITASQAPNQNVTVQLTSGNPARLLVPPTVVLLAGRTTATFNLTTVDDQVVETTPTPITVTAHVENWTDGAGTVNLLDNDQTLAVVLPASTWEGRQNTGTVQIGGTSTSPVVVTLASGNANALTVPAGVTIPAGSTSATFTFTAVQDAAHQGPQSVVVTGTATGFPTCATSTQVLDDNLDHFSLGTIAGPQEDGVPFSVTIQACDVLGNAILTYDGTVSLTALGQGGPLSITPASITFVSGEWSGNVTVNGVDPGAALRVNGNGVVAPSNTFTVQPGPVAAFQWSTVGSSQIQGVAFPATLTAVDANGYTATNYSGPAPVVSGAAISGAATSQTILGAPGPTYGGSNGTNAYTLGYSFTPAANFEVTAVCHYFGTKVSIWTATGILLASQTYSATPGSWTETALASPIQLLAGSTYVVSVYTAGQTYYWQPSLISGSPVGTVNQGYETTGDGFPTLADGAQWFVDLSGNLAATTPLLMSPMSPAFSNGVWTGNVTVWQAANNAYLQAGDNNASNTFNVRAETAPVATVALDSHSGETNDVLTATATKSDAQGDPVALTFIWTVNGVVKRSFTSASALTDTFNLSMPGNGDVGDTVAVTVTPNDGYLFGASASDTATVVYSPPTVTTPASATPSTVTGTSTALLVLGADADVGAGSLTYTWVATTLPSGAAAPIFSLNGTNAAQSSTATFSMAGSYTFQVAITNPAGLSVTSSVNVTVNQTLASISVQATSGLATNGTEPFSATALDQFSKPLSTQPSFAWSVSGGGNISGTGVYTPPDAAGTVTIQATGDSLTGSDVVALPGLAQWNGKSHTSWGTVSSWMGPNSKAGSPGLRSVTGDGVVFSTSDDGTVDLNGASPSLAAVTFNDATATIAPGTGGSLHLNGGGSPATLTVAAGWHTISAPVVLDSSVTVLPAADWELTVSGGISGSGGLSVDAPGTMVLGGADTYTGGTNVLAGTLAATSASAIPDNTSLVVGSGGIFIFDPNFVATPLVATAAVTPAITTSADAATASTATTTLTSSDTGATPGHPVLRVAPSSASAASSSPAGSQPTVIEVPVAGPRLAVSPFLQSNPKHVSFVAPASADRRGPGTPPAARPTAYHVPNAGSALVNQRSAGRNLPAPSAALPPPQSVSAGTLGPSQPRSRVVSSSIVKNASADFDLVWLGQSASSFDNSDQRQKQGAAIQALDVVFSQFV